MFRLTWHICWFFQPIQGKIPNEPTRKYFSESTYDIILLNKVRKIISINNQISKTTHSIEPAANEFVSGRFLTSGKLLPIYLSKLSRLSYKWHLW